MGELVGVPPEHVTLFWRGRVALYAILRALGIGPGDEVIVPAFTCVAVPNAVLYTGATPVYVDIDEATYTADPAAVAAAMSPRTRVVLAQNTFGLSADLDALTAVARPTAPSWSTTARTASAGPTGPANGAAADAAFFSTQWSKPISTGLGGIAVTTDPGSRAGSRRSSAPPRSRARSIARCWRRCSFARERIATPRTLRAGRAVYRAASRAGVVPGSSRRRRARGDGDAGSFVTRMSAFQARLGSRRLATLAARVAAAARVAERYSAWLAAHGRTAAREPDRPSTRSCAIRCACASATPSWRRRNAAGSLGDWFHSPLYPIAGDLSVGLSPGANPVAERVASEIVNLPTDVAPDGRELRAVEELLEASVDHVL